MRRYVYWFFVVVIVFFVFYLISPKDFIIGPTSAEYVGPDFPKLTIQLEDYDLNEIKNSEKGNPFKTQSVSFETKDENVVFSDVLIFGHGNSTWTAEKKPYRLKFNSKVSLFNKGKSKNWILLANSFDDSNIRNSVANIFLNYLGSNFNLDGEYVELYFGENYEGLYYITEKIDSSKIRARSQDGILIEVENIHELDQDTIYNIADNGDVLTLSDSISDDESYNEVLLSNFTMDYNNLLKYISESNFEMISEVVNIDSFVNYFLISEISNNLDAYSTSFYFFRDESNGKISVGPAWDFDLSFGNINSNEVFISPTSFLAKREDGLSYSNMFFDLMQIPEFFQAVREKYLNSVSNRKPEISLEVERISSKIHESSRRDRERWGKNFDFERDTSYLIQWIKFRLDALDEVFSSPFPL